MLTDLVDVLKNPPPTINEQLTGSVQKIFSSWFHTNQVITNQFISNVKDQVRDRVRETLVQNNVNDYEVRIFDFDTIEDARRSRPKISISYRQPTSIEWVELDLKGN